MSSVRAKQVHYLGSIVTEKNVTDKEVAARIVSENKCFYGLSKILGSRSLTLEMEKTVIYNLNTLICYLWGRDLAIKKE
jgi:hypothetical protein